MIEILLCALQSVIAQAHTTTSSNDCFGLRQIVAAPKNAGTFHFGLGTWTRAGFTPDLLSTDIVYNNTCPQPYYGPIANGQTITDEGRIPSPTGPTTPTGIPGHYNDAPGCQTSYVINAFRIGYCTDRTVFDVVVGFQEAYLPCSPPASQHSFSLSGLPHSQQIGVESCWLVTVDLQAAGLSFDMKADGTGAYNWQEPARNYFGCSFSITSDVGGVLKSGPMMAGSVYNDIQCTGVDGTRWDIVPGSAAPTWPTNLISGPNWTPEDGTGMDAISQIRVDGGTNPPPGCYYLTSPLLSFNLRLFANANCPPPSGAPFCSGDGSLAAPCPCGNGGITGHGCNNSEATGGATLAATGVVSPDTIVLYSLGELPNSFSIFLQGSSNIAAGTPFGDGLRCVGGVLKRIGAHNAQSGVASYPHSGELGIKAKSAALGDPIPAGATRYYQTYYRDPSLAFCPSPQGNTWNVSSGIQIVWQ